MSNNPLSTFFKEMGKHDLLTRTEELELFNNIDDLRAEIIHEINKTAVLYTKIPHIIKLIKSGEGALKTYVSIYKHDLKMKELLPYCLSSMGEYTRTFEQYIEKEDPNIVYNLDVIMYEILFEDSLLEECVFEILNTEPQDSEDSLLLLDTELSKVQKDLGLLIKKFRTIKNRVIEGNLRLVISEAKKYQNSQGHYQLSDLIQEGTFGLIKAVDRYDVDAGTKFGTFATWWVRQSIIRSLQNNARTIRVPVATQDYTAKINKFKTAYKEDHGVFPSEMQIAQHLGITLQRVQEIIDSSVSTTSIDTEIGEEGEGLTLSDIIPDEDSLSGYDIINRSQAQYRINKALTQLPEVEKTLVEMRFGFDEDPKTLAEVAMLLGCCKQTVKNYEDTIIAKLKKLL